MMDETLFATLADATLMHLFETIDSAAGDELEVDLGEGILTVEREDGGQYVINKHAPNRQIWMSSPVSGARYFRYDTTSTSWVDARATSDGEAMIMGVVLGRELSAALGRELDLAAPGTGME
ncbi:MAG: iron donor protein CyaY [Alphaproteobacteria bacterium]|mgnify:FL=1|jgi:frataxin|nr:iron donor protein CyaY [Rhodospirillaceae bacterium]MDP6031016.1 iron donor protein CyaY [Alphaproteobacteria bacterium]MDP7183315.1 iron donor protein CyaY [Alphaproteobacteria bacterium]HJO89089.1 iron donor protein CyaY [Alphaproteobacteria bacterium]|tara:strand:+ start:847 stop:1212 length:366 start_codon:yes stop_codon:yes gene_type:complete